MMLGIVICLSINHIEILKGEKMENKTNVYTHFEVKARPKKVKDFEQRLASVEGVKVLQSIKSTFGWFYDGVIYGPENAVSSVAENVKLLQNKTFKRIKLNLHLVRADPQRGSDYPLTRLEAINSELDHMFEQTADLSANVDLDFKSRGSSSAGCLDGYVMGEPESVLKIYNFLEAKGDCRLEMSYLK